MKKKYLPQHSIELSAPAGDWCSLRTAVAEGADSVYFGVRSLNMRQGAKNFDVLEIGKIMRFLHENNKKGYLALNSIIYNEDISRSKKILHACKKYDVDAVILWDMALLSMAISLGLDIHLSTQAGVANADSFAFYASLGIKRIVLARECTISDIAKIAKTIKKEHASCQLEAFVHGAMCVSVSGRCFLSHEAFGKSANRGECLQPCRRMFYIEDVEGETSYRIGPNYILSPKDLCTIPFLDRLLDAGISVLKIEGRNRSAEYVKEVTGCYREAITAYHNKSLSAELKGKLVKRLELVYNRGLDSGFYLGKPGALDNKLETRYEKIYVGEVKRFFSRLNVADILIRKGPIYKGSKILITGKNTPADYCIIKEMQQNKKPVNSADKGMRIGVKLSFKVHVKDKVFLIRHIS
jgi:U32 family peptidase